MTGDVLAPDTRVFPEQTGAEYLTRPFETRDLVAAVARTIRRSGPTAAAGATGLAASRE